LAASLSDGQYGSLVSSTDFPSTHNLDTSEWLQSTKKAVSLAKIIAVTMLQQRSWSAGVLANDTARGRKSTRLEIFHYSWRSSQFGGIFAQSRGKRKDV
jgi:hypothetical protein